MCAVIWIWVKHGLERPLSQIVYTHTFEWQTFKNAYGDGKYSTAFFKFSELKTNLSAKY